MRDLFDNRVLTYLVLLIFTLFYSIIGLVDIKEIQKGFAEKNYRYTRHGTEQRLKRSVTEKEIGDAVHSGEIIENYPSDKYGPSCLVFGRTESGKPLHVQVAFVPVFSIVTVYEPEPEKWIDCKIRRR